VRPSGARRGSLTVRMASHRIVIRFACAKPKAAMPVMACHAHGGATAPAPDGRTVAFVVTEADLQPNTRNSDVWIVRLMAANPSFDFTAPNAMTGRNGQPIRGDWRLFPTAMARPQVYVIFSNRGEAQKVTDVKTAVQSSPWSPMANDRLHRNRAVSEEREKEKKAGFDRAVVDAD